jgi:superfamily II DNA or RNA helicase
LKKNKNIKILGISATPSRHPIYDQDYFYRAFCDQETGSPVSEYTAIYAINQKWLTQPQWKVVSNACAGLKNYTPIKGKYNGKLMREWWSTLRKDVDLVEKIVAEIKANGLKKGLIYLPPVGEDLSNFVEDFKDEILGYGEVLDIQSRECINPEKEIKKFRVSKDPVFLISINRASEGISIPEIDSLIMLRMPLSDNLAIQMIGRGLRLHPQKKRLVILDAVGYEKRLRLIPAWGQATAKQIRESQEALAEIEVKSAGAEAKADPSIKRFVDLVVECR